MYICTTPPSLHVLTLLFQTQALNTEKQIRAQFEELHQFLRNEEAVHIAALKAEERKKTHMMEKRLGKINKDITTLAGIVKATEKAMQTEHAAFLQVRVTWTFVSQ